MEVKLENITIGPKQDMWFKHALFYFIFTTLYDASVKYFIYKSEEMIETQNHCLE